MSIVLSLALGLIGGYMAVSGHWIMGAVVIFAAVFRQYVDKVR